MGLALVLAATAIFSPNAAGAPNGAMAWGGNEFGQLGTGLRSNSWLPIAVSSLSGVIQVAAGHDHSLALLSDGKVMAWGANGVGQLGDGSLEPSLVPVEVKGLQEVTAISAGKKYSLALLSDGKVMAWGLNDYGQLGDGGKANSDVPVEVKGLREVHAISAGQKFADVLLRNGTVKSWGFNGPVTQGGELGIGTPIGPEVCVDGNQCSRVPVPVVGLSGATAVSAGFTHSLVLLSDGTVMAWGGDSYLELGGPGTNLD
ncbi:MAG TPA: hypothetical protein VKG62_04785 [Solirubrobacteraceae bacterium]|nr:hypothetical protein [Solirubrobacteraceae bacterium]